MYIILYGMWHGWVLPCISQRACRETAYPWAGVNLIRTFLHFCFFQIFLQHFHWLNKLLSLWCNHRYQVPKAQSLSMDKLPFESSNSVSVVVHHGRHELFVRIDMNKYANTQITQDNLPWGHWKLIALYIITLGFDVHQMENVSR